jgi:hypothetical protein
MKAGRQQRVDGLERLRRSARRYGRALPKDIYCEKAVRFNLPFFWYDAALRAETSVLRIQDAVLNQKVSIENAQRGGMNILPECIDAFSPLLERGKLDSFL